MTLRTMEEVLFEKIKKRPEGSSSLYDLSLDAPLYDLEHPRIIRARLEFENDPKHEPEKFQHQDWSAAFYGNATEAQRHHPGILISFRGTPFEIGRFLQQNINSAVINFDSLGTAVLSRNHIEQGESPGVHQHVLSPWLTYALSPELWAPFGKWHRFHERLHTLFEKYHLLNEDDFPGYYPLKPEASVLEKHGFKGSIENQKYILQLNWTFSLTALEKLENAVSKEL